MAQSSRIRLYIALSLDGFIADTSGGVEWLSPHEARDVGFDRFMDEIDTIVAGRRTYDQARQLPAWPYGGKHMIVLTNSPLDANAPRGVETYRGKVGPLAEKLKSEVQGDVWLLGGTDVAQQFLDLALIDRIELYLVPVLLGGGVRLFAPVDRMRTLAFSEACSYPNGIVGLVYDLAPKLRAP